MIGAKGAVRTRSIYLAPATTERFGDGPGLSPGYVICTLFCVVGIVDFLGGHRLGRLEIGETSVTIVVAAGHRGPAFEACRYAIDRLKKIVPIWKKEFFADGAVWAEGEGQRRVLVEAHNRDA